MPNNKGISVGFFGEVKIEKMFDIHDNQTVIIQNSYPSEETGSQNPIIIDEERACGQDMHEKSEPTELHPSESLQMPESMQSDSFLLLLKKAKRKGWLDDSFMPTSKVGKQQVAALAQRLVEKSDYTVKLIELQRFWRGKSFSIYAKRAYESSKNKRFLDQLEKL